MPQEECTSCQSRAVDFGLEAGGEVAQLLIPFDIPVDFQGARLNLRNGGVAGGSYSLRNNSAAGLVTLVIRWRFYGDDPARLGAMATEVIDSWATDSAFLAPGGEEELKLDLTVVRKGEAAVRRVTGTVVYAEFDDGTKVGPGAAEFGPHFRSQREKVLAAYRELLRKIQSGATMEEVDKYVQTKSEFGTLNSLRGQKGLDWIVAEITKQRRLAP